MNTAGGQKHSKWKQQKDNYKSMGRMYTHNWLI